MTAFDVLEMQRAAYKKSCRRHAVFARILDYFRIVALVSGLMFCFVYRAEISRLIDHAWSSSTARSAQVRR